jgi:hypothetical protein
MNNTVINILKNRGFKHVAGDYIATLYSSARATPIELIVKEGTEPNGLNSIRIFEVDKESGECIPDSDMTLDCFIELYDDDLTEIPEFIDSAVSFNILVNITKADIDDRDYMEFLYDQGMDKNTAIATCAKKALSCWLAGRDVEIPDGRVI